MIHHARTSALALLCAVVAGCTSMPPPQDTFYFDENAMAPLPSAPVDYVPLEQVQVPPPVEPTPIPTAPTQDDAAPAPQASPVPDPQTSAGGVTNPPGAPIAREPIVVASLPPEKPAAPEIPPADLEALTLMSDLVRYSALSPDDVKRDLATLTQTFRNERNDANRVRLAVIYTMTHSPQDDLRALQLLDNVAKSGGPHTAVKELAAVLQAQVIERTRALHDEQQRANDAVQKLEALRQMERSLLRDRVSSGGGSGGGGAGGGGR